MLRTLSTPLLLLALAASPATGQTLIDFELGGPCTFAGAQPLTSEYSTLGVTFSGPAPGSGGAALDDCGGFGVNARSGTNFLAFNPGSMLATGQPPAGPETITFSGVATSASIWGAGGLGSGATFEMEAFSGATSVALDTQSVGGGNNYVQLSVSVPTGFDRLVLREVSGKSAWVFDDFEFSAFDAGTAYCFGDGAGTPCPCGNNGGAGEGCANSTGSGAVLGAGGSASVAADDLAFQADNLIPSQPALLFVADNAVNAGSGVTFGDGLRCAGGNVRRLGVKSPDSNGAATWGPGLNALGGWSAGQTQRFQAWYRDPSGPCATGFNLSHGVEVTFQP